MVGHGETQALGRSGHSTLADVMRAEGGGHQRALVCLSASNEWDEKAHQIGTNVPIGERPRLHTEPRGKLPPLLAGLCAAR